MPSRSRFSRRSRGTKFVRRRVSTSRFKSRRGRVSGRMAPRRGLLRRGGRGGKHKRLSKQAIRNFFPDIAVSKLKGHHVWTGIPCNDISTALAFQQGTTTSNTFTVVMNANPNNGGFYTQPGTDTFATDELNPVKTYVTRYTKYRPMGCKVTVTVFSQDNGVANPNGGVANVQVATPFMLYGFPFVFSVDGSIATLANHWSGAPANGFTGDTIPQMKYGFRRISTGLGGKNGIKYTTYWDFAKLCGLTRDQYMANTGFAQNPDDDTTNNVPICLALAVADYTPALARQCTVDIKITQYGRWEGQEILFE